MAQVTPQVSRYHWVLVVLHWSLAFLILAALTLGALALVRIPSSDPMKIEALRTHMTGGIAILLLMLVRLSVRLRSARPPDADTGNPWLDRLAVASHRALYVAVLAQAAVGLTMGIETGVVALVLGGHPPIPDDFWVYPIRTLHYAISRVLMVLIALHVSGALYHTFIRKDGLLRRMWFGRRAVMAGPPAGAALRRPF
jgi:cytochrome b561